MILDNGIQMKATNLFSIIDFSFLDLGFPFSTWRKNIQKLIEHLVYFIYY